jgi:hypothetical protein
MAPIAFDHMEFHFDHFFASGEPMVTTFARTTTANDIAGAGCATVDNLVFCMAASWATHD